MLNYFIGIGAQKAGTTWLANYFIKHHEVCFSPIKELHHFDAKFVSQNKYFDKVFINRLKREVKALSYENFDLRNSKIIRSLLYRVEMVNNSNAYLEYFDWLNSNGIFKISGEITPAYSLIGEKGFDYMNRMISNIKVIFLMRNPIDRHWSNLKYLKDKRGFDPYNEFRSSFQDFQYIERSNYKSTLKCLKSIFSPSQLYIAFYEDLFSADKSERTVSSLCNFLNISYIKPDITKKKNVSVKLDLDKENKMFGVNELRSNYEYVLENFSDVPEVWHDNFNEFISQ